MLEAPFPWFGGKRRAAKGVWARFGSVANYVEPFFGSGAVLFGRPGPVSGTETINDKDGFVSNFWRAVKADPGAVAGYANNPVNENDLHARHIWLVNNAASLVPSLEGDPYFYDAKIAGWWVWGVSCWIGSGFCSGNGSWKLNEQRQLVHLGNTGQGVKRQLVHLGTAGQGVKRKRVHLGSADDSGLIPWFHALAARLRNVRVCSGDWSRVCGPTPTYNRGMTAVFLDPPYSHDVRDVGLYSEDQAGISDKAREWAIETGKRPDMRIALCGYDGEHEMPLDWKMCVGKATHGPGYGAQAEKRSGNHKLERIWYSPACLSPGLF